MQIKIKKRYYYILIRMAKIQNTDNIKCQQGFGARGVLIYGSWECKNGTATLEDSMAVSKRN